MKAPVFEGLSARNGLLGDNTGLLVLIADGVCGGLLGDVLEAPSTVPYAG